MKMKNKIKHKITLEDLISNPRKIHPKILLDTLTEMSKALESNPRLINARHKVLQATNLLELLLYKHRRLGKDIEVGMTYPLTLLYQSAVSVDEAAYELEKIGEDEAIKTSVVAMIFAGILYRQAAIYALELADSYIEKSLG